MIETTTSGFSFKDWKRTVYPENLKPSDYLAYFNRELGFRLVEINSTYYNFLSHKTAYSWMKNTDDDFKFVIKLNRGLTQNESRDYPLKEINAAVAADFMNSIEPIVQEGRLIALLAQFCPMFTRNRAHGEYLIKLRESMGDLPLLIEFRHPSWLKPDKRDETFAFLARHNLGYVTADLSDNPGLPPITPNVVGDTGYLRLHGRPEKWFGAGMAQRYNYNYNDSELKSFIPVLRSMDKIGKLTIAAFNNCHGGLAMHNALRLRGLLAEEENI
ncbi:MAG: DUF72 domain-containing protein [Chloroflexi bacterium]|nr:DUF72 domain-containing protein [Chloroflexota bacterium]